MIPLAKIMKKRIRPLSTAIVCVALVSGCASIPRSDLPESQFAQLDCAGLQHEATQAEETRRVASEARGDAWKVIVPAAALTRYAYARSAASGADRRLELLAAVQALKGCNVPGERVR